MNFSGGKVLKSLVLAAALLLAPQSFAAESCQSTLANEGLNERQAKAWSALDAGDIASYQKIEEMIAENLESGKIVSNDAANRHSATIVRFVTFENGERGVFKVRADANWASNYRSEIDAYYISWRLGLGIVPVTVMRTVDGQVGSMQFLIPTNGGSASNLTQAYMSIFDFLVHNTDRHSGNHLTYNGRKVAIDHGLCFRDGVTARTGNYAAPAINTVHTYLQMLKTQYANHYMAFIQNLTSFDENEIRKLLRDHHSEASVSAVIDKRKQILDWHVANSH